MTIRDQARHAARVVRGGLGTVWKQIKPGSSLSGDHGPKIDRLERLCSTLVQIRGSSAECSAIESNFLGHCTVANIQSSKAQLLQDIFVISSTDGKREGFFVEFGATDGVSLSNTYLLETAFGWSGILAEPARCWHSSLLSNRACSKDLRCVWSKSDARIAFNETKAAEFSTINSFSELDKHASSRVDGRAYTVETVSLVDLLNQHNAPNVIDYLSVDTEGSEFEILRHFDFNYYRIKIITIEHNYNQKHRNFIFSLLTSKGYKRVLQQYSLWDDWYVSSD